MRPLNSPRLLAEDAAAQIRTAILTGQLKPGERLVEATVARQLNVSRGPVREALKLLGAEGLVQDEPRRGAFVLSLTTLDVREIYDLRAALEARAAKRVTEAAKPASLRALRKSYNDMHKLAEKGDVTVFARADLKFHETICTLSGNQRLHAMFLRYVPLLYSLIKLDEFLYSSMDEVAEDHLPMLEAVESGDAALAARLFEEHADRAQNLVVSYLEEQTRIEAEKVPEPEPVLTSQVS
jgi:GntR family transcriptional regulator of gluconate operon